MAAIVAVKQVCAPRSRLGWRAEALVSSQDIGGCLQDAALLQVAKEVEEMSIQMVDEAK
jgi:hypothetical protein